MSLSLVAVRSTSSWWASTSTSFVSFTKDTWRQSGVVHLVAGRTFQLNQAAPWESSILGKIVSRVSFQRSNGTENCFRPFCRYGCHSLGSLLGIRTPANLVTNDARMAPSWSTISTRSNNSLLGSWWRPMSMIQLPLTRTLSNASVIRLPISLPLLQLPTAHMEQRSVTLVSSLLSSLLSSAIWYMKRTFQPSIMRKKRKMGYLVRQRTVGGRRTLARRRLKGRARLGGGI